MKTTIFGFLAVIAVAHAGVLNLLPSSALVRTPSLDSAVVHSERLGGAFSYSTLENHAYAPVIHSYNIIPQYHQIYYPAQHPVQHPIQHPVYQIHPAYAPTLGGIPAFGGVPTFGGYPYPQPAPGINPQNPVEVESPADNTGTSGDDDTVTVESA